MNELIPINYESDTPTVSGRELHEALTVDTPYTIWFPRMCEYGFEEGKDYITILLDRSDGLPGKPKTDHRLTLPMAKEIAMLQRNEKGKTIRQYLIKIEEAWNTPEMVMSRALKLADGKIKLLETDNAALTAKIESDRPLVLFAHSVDASKGSILIRELAKLLKQNDIDIGEKRLYDWLRRNGYLIKNSGIDYNMPTQKSMNLGLFEIKETAITHASGNIVIHKTPRVTGKGQIYFVNKFKAA